MLDLLAANLSTIFDFLIRPMIWSISMRSIPKSYQVDKGGILILFLSETLINVKLAATWIK